MPIALAPLFLRPGLASLSLPEPLARLLGSDLGFARPRVVANFAASLDGVVALPGSEESGGVISGHSEADHFLMALLRACADAVLIGAGTVRRAGEHRWRASGIDPEPGRAPLYAAWRRHLGLREHPLLVVVSGSGEIDPGHPALDDAWVVTTARGARRLGGRLPAGARLLALDSDPLRLGEVIDRLRQAGLSLILTEGGPSLVSQLIAERRLDELLVTASPRLFGRTAGDGRTPLITGFDVAGTTLELQSVHRDGSHLFLRYALS